MEAVPFLKSRRTFSGGPIHVPPKCAPSLKRPQKPRWSPVDAVPKNSFMITMPPRRGVVRPTDKVPGRDARQSGAPGAPPASSNVVSSRLSSKTRKCRNHRSDRNANDDEFVPWDHHLSTRRRSRSRRPRGAMQAARNNLRSGGDGSYSRGKLIATKVAISIGGGRGRGQGKTMTRCSRNRMGGGC